MKRNSLERLHYIIIAFLIAFVLSAVFLVLRKQGVAEKFALIAFFILMFGWVGDLILRGIKNVIGAVKYVFDKLINMPRYGIIILIAVFYCFSLFQNYEHDNKFGFRLPEVYGGDEEHYLIMINSMIKDYDLDLANNYENARNGGYDAGRLWRDRILDHHSIYVHKETNKNVKFSKLVDVGHKLKSWLILRKDMYESLGEYNERPQHPPGMPFVFSFFLFPLAGWKYLEVLALLMMAAVSLMGFYYLDRILERLEVKRELINVVLFLLAIATPMYFYSIILFKEAFLAALLVIICWTYFFKKKGFLSGILVTLGCFTRYSFPVLVIPLIVYSILKKEWKQLSGFLISGALGAISLLLYNYYIYGGVLTFSQAWQFRGWLTPQSLLTIFVAVPLSILAIYYIVRFIIKSRIFNKNYEVFRTLVFITGIMLLFLTGIYRSSIKSIFIDLQYGLIPFSPVLLFAVFSLLDIKSWSRDKTIGIMGIILMYIGIYAAKGFVVGSAFSARQIVPIIPLLGIPLCYFLQNYKGRCIVRIFYIFAAYSLIVNVIAVYAQRYFWHLPLNESLIKLFNDFYQSII